MDRNIDVARALKDKAYFDSLSPEEQAYVRSVSPTGEIELTDDDLNVASGGLVAGSGSGTGAGFSDVPSSSLPGTGTCHCHCNT